jgi:hypothetical protein
MYSFTVCCRIFFQIPPEVCWVRRPNWLLLGFYLPIYRDVLRQDWRLTEVECTLYTLTLYGAQLITDPSTQYGAFKHKILGPSLWERRWLWVSKRQVEDMNTGLETGLKYTVFTRVIHALFFNQNFVSKFRVRDLCEETILRRFIWLYR